MRPALLGPRPCRIQRASSSPKVAVLVALAMAACAPKVATTPSPFERDDPRAGSAVTVTSPTDGPASDSATGTATGATAANSGPRLRETRVPRADLLAGLAAGPGPFLRQFDVASELRADQFIGWRLVQLANPGPSVAQLDLQPNDILLAVNGQVVGRPDQLMAVWTSLATANEVVCDLARGQERFRLRVIIDDAPGT